MEPVTKKTKTRESTRSALFIIPDDATSYADVTRDVRQVIYKNADPLLLMQMASSDRRARMLDLDDTFWKDFVYRDFPLEVESDRLVDFAMFADKLLAAIYKIDMTDIENHKEIINRLATQKIYIGRPWKQLYIFLRQIYGQVFIAASIPAWMAELHQNTVKHFMALHRYLNYEVNDTGPIKNTDENRKLLQKFFLSRFKRNHWFAIFSMWYELPRKQALSQRGDVATNPDVTYKGFSGLVLSTHKPLPQGTLRASFVIPPGGASQDAIDTLAAIFWLVYPEVDLGVDVPLQRIFESGTTLFERFNWVDYVDSIMELIPTKDEQEKIAANKFASPQMTAAINKILTERIKNLKRALFFYLPIISRQQNNALKYMNEPICATCQTTEGQLFMCGDCKSVIYCSEECALMDNHSCGN